MPPTGSFLDQLVDRFRHRWETNRQYRAAASGVLGLVVLIALCSCAGIVSSVTSRVLANSGFGGNSTIGSLNGTAGPALPGAEHFPTETIPTWQPGQIPNGPPIPNSGTPYPTPTHPPTPTAAPSPTDSPTQPGGGGGGTACSGTGSHGSTWALSPCPVSAGTTITLTIIAPNNPNQSPNILFGLGACTGGATCFWDYPPGTYSTDGSGVLSLSFAVPAQAAHNSQNITGSVTFGSNGASVSIKAPPVQ
jgi:hypothetical protein